MNRRFSTFVFSRSVVLGALLLILSAGSAFAATVTLAWDPNPETNVTGYIVAYGTTSGQYGVSQDVGNQTSFQFTEPDVTKTYYFIVRAYDATGLQSAPSTEVSTVSIQLSTVSVSALTSNLVAPQPPLTTVGFTAKASGGTGPLQYKWWLLNGSAWQVEKDWSTSNTLSWQPTNPNASYAMKVWVRSATSTADAPDNPSAVASMPFPIVAASTPAPAPAPVPLSVTSVTANLASPQVIGTTIQFAASSTGGVAPISYKWLVSNGAAWTVARGWSTSNTFTWTPTTANAGYLVGVWARNATNTSDAPENINAGTSMAFPITAPVVAPPPTSTPLSVTGMKASLPSPQLSGTTIQFAAYSNGGVAPISYKWLVSNGAAWTVARDWSTSNAFAWTPTVANAGYVVAVWARNATNTADAPENINSGTSTSFAITAPIVKPAEKVVLSSLTANKPAPQFAGTTMTFTATASGAALLQYKFWVSNGRSWTVAQEWSTNNTFNWTPTTTNANYGILVRVQNAINTADSAGLSMPFPIVKTNRWGRK